MKTMSQWNIMNRKNSCIVFFVLLALLIIFGVFVFNFCNQQLSPKVSDWGSFGSYVGGSMGIISFFLLYLTYNNQVKMNRWSQFEAILYKMVDNLYKLFQENKDDWRKVYDGISGYFAIDLVDVNLLNVTNMHDAVMQCYGYYSSDTSIERCMNIFTNIIEYVDDEESLDGHSKMEYYSFVSSQMSNEVMSVVMIQLIAKKNERMIKVLDEVGFFNDVQLDNRVLEKLRSLYFSKTTPNHMTKVKPIEEIKIDFGEENIGCFMDYYSNHIAQ